MSTECNCNLGPLEREVLKIVWTKDCPSVRCVLIELNLHRSPKDKLAYTTVMTILKRLTKKGVLVRRKQGRGYHYEANQPKQKFFQQLANQTLLELKEEFGEAIIFVLKKEVNKY